MFRGRSILLGVTGSIAAYKAVDIASRVKKKGAEVDVVMTRSAAEFVTPLTFRSITGRPVYTDLFDEPKTWNIEHISLAQKADITLIAPATANILAKMAVGIADDFLSTVLMAVKNPIFVAPAMNHAMYHHPATEQNLEILQQRGVNVIGPAKGYQACGTEGDGRMVEAAEIVAYLEGFFADRNLLQGRHVLVTAGGTREELDPVRYLGNYSSGKMGYAIAQAFTETGAQVTLVSGPTAIPVPSGVDLVRVTSAEEMYEEVLQRYNDLDIVVKAAAVADFRPASRHEQKIKKDGQAYSLELIPNPDILAALGEKKKHQFLVGFAAETQNSYANGLDKMKRKNVDMLVVNDVTVPGAGFGTDTNIVSFLYADGRKLDLPKMSKIEIARTLVKEIAALIKGNLTKE
ncbi:bifunctional phosphopantothenoylcysteine decarboxylase/phosphopantothenate--cysteine ligase CoaBC [Dehalobacter sp. DCM]|uniref:bifunctional phosphopantothenoylcysteine decarboxylase/phosphopantothenate--cysteine ligase CoaBC n=1 Tax=Dehalobacter sp. DCM TaxID=2907827 RepID=UPI0030815A10|nr:bifunctional phosphopantothenoylcysteine decarboxylase/phosphopantothenate--cysteine ligase CoaBC [Dehalobacter sp. DCM]